MPLSLVAVPSELDRLVCCFPLLFLVPEALTAVVLIDLSPERERSTLHHSFCKYPKLQNPFLAVYCVCDAQLSLSLFLCV